MKRLLIVESPAKIKTISKILGNDFKIMSTVGHIMDLPPKKIGVTINKKGAIALDYVVMKNKEQVISEIVKAAQKCDEVLLAPDPDREGEIIAWHIGQEIAKVLDPKKIRRITFNEITKEAILDAISHPSDVNMQRVAAQQARRVLDRWVGYEVSPILWRKITRGLSAGRVQSVALKLVCDRETAIRDFKPEEFWSIDGKFKHGKENFIAELALIDNKKFELKNEAETKLVVDQIKKASFKVDTIQDKKRTKNPVAPFMTSTLQQAAYNQLGFSVKKTMQVAQKLYEGMPLKDLDTPVALITYMRTDSLRVADSAISNVRKYIGKNFDKEYLPSTPNVYAKGKAKAVNAQDAHEAIRPISVDISPEEVAKYLPKDSYKLYELIWKRFVASQMKPALYAQRTVTIIGDKFTFKIVGSTLIFDGFLKVYKDEDEEDKKTKLPKDLAEQAPLGLEKVDPKQHFTQAPPRYTEASLVKELEKEGIGRPSTYASILSTIQTRAYTELDDKKRFMPTELGFAVTNLLAKNLPKIMNTKFTAHMEDDLDKISQGELERDVLLKDFYSNFKDDLKKFSESENIAREIDMPCPQCKKHNLSIRFGKAGEFLGCTNYPECNFTSNFTRTDDGKIELKATAEPVLLEETCPKCGKQLREMVGKYGKFISCSGYPDCKYIKQDKADVKCTSCQSDLVKRRWIGGQFWGCAGYPKCNFAVFGDIAKVPCPECKHPYMGSRQLKTGTVITCPNKACKYKYKK